MNKQISLRRLFIAVTAGALASGTAFGQEGVLEEVVVTAQKRVQSSEDLGLAISVLDSKTLEAERILALDDVGRSIPSLDIFRGNGSNNPTVTLRGIGTTNPWVNNNPSVAAHADGVYLPMSAYLTFPIFDLERIEVLKGPQVGLYGRNATAGAINFVSRRPDQEASGYADLSYGSYDAVDLQAAIGGPISESVSGRIALLWQDGGGWMDRPGTVDSTAGFTRVPGVVPGIDSVEPEDDYGDRDIMALRGSVLFAPSDGFEALLSVHWADDESEIIGSTNINGDRLGVFVPPTDAPFFDYDNVLPAVDSTQTGGVLEMTWYRGNANIVSVTGVEGLDRIYNIGDFVPTRIAEASFDEDLNSFYQEFRYDYQPSEDFRLLFGASYTDDEIDYARVLTAYDLLLGALGTAFVENDESLALFGQTEWRFAPAWLLTASLRYTEEDKEYDGGSFSIDPFGVSAVGSVFPNVVPDGLFDQRTYEDDDVSGRVGLQWDVSDEMMWFASIAKAFKSGGFDGSGITEPASFTPYGAEHVWAYEAGTKLRGVGGRLRFEGSAFYYDYDDKQVLSLQDLGGGIVEAVIENAATSEVYGVDLKLDWLLTDSTTLNVSGTWLDSEVTDWDSADPAEVAARIGNTLPGTPELSIAGGIDWQGTIGDYGLGVRLWANYTDEAYRDIENTDALLSDDYVVTNARITLGQQGERWNVYLYAENLFDEEYVTSRRSLVGMLGDYYGPPQTFGIGVRYQMQ